MKIQRIAGALGAELQGVDLTQAMSNDLQQAIRSALLEHLVIFFRDQNLTTTQFMRFAQTMGEPVEYPFVRGLDNFPCVIEVKKLEHEKNNFGGIWHSDTTYLEKPPMGSMLLAREIPPFGGDTLFAHIFSKSFNLIFTGIYKTGKRNGVVLNDIYFAGQVLAKPGQFHCILQVIV